MAAISSGKIITFYSYKGGTGRSMMLANVAWILASNGKRVLAIDWDLEAPGLYRYFYPFLVDKDLTSSDGVIDFVIDFAVEATTPDERSKGPEKDWYKSHANILRYAASLDWEFPKGGTIDFIPAGRQGPSYSTRANSFNWQDFYNRFGGGVFLEAAKEKMRAEYDYTLIDSRTGVSDTAGICTVQMPDSLVACFTLNNQSIEGAAAVVASVYEQRKESGLRIFPVPMRIENAEKDKLDLRWKLARERFAPFPLHILANEEREKYWNDIQVPYVPYYAYEEILATFGDKPGGRRLLLPSAERLTAYLTDGEVEQLVPPPEDKREDVLAQYEGKPVKVDPAKEQIRIAEAVFARFTPEEQVLARRVFTRLVRLGRPEEEVEDTRRRTSLAEISEEARPVVKALTDAHLLVMVRDEDKKEDTFEVAHEAIIRDWARLRRWLDEDREFLLWRQRLQAALNEWERSEHDEGILLRGTPLAEAEDWLAERPDNLTRNERDFIQKGVALREREQAARERLRRRIAWIVVGAAAGFLILALVAWLQLWRAEQQRRIALSHQLATQALTRVDSQSDLAFLLSLESYRIDNNVEAQSSLLTGLQNTPHLNTFLHGHKSGVLSVAFSRDGRLLASGSMGGKVILWDVEKHKALSDTLTGHRSNVWSVAFSPDGKLLASGSEDNKIILWDVETHKQSGQLLTGRDTVTSVAFSRDGKLLASGSAVGGKIILWDVEKHKTLGDTLTGHRGGVSSVAFSPDGKWLASASMDSTVILWDVEKRQALGKPLIGHGNIVTSVAFSPDGKLLASGSRDGTIILWDVETHKPLQHLTAHRDAVSSVAFSPDWKGKLLASGSWDKTVILWDVEKRQALGDPLTGHGNIVTSVAFSPDKERLRLASGSMDGTVILWDVEKRQALGDPLTGYRNKMYGVAFSPDGKLLASGSEDGTVILWDVEKRQQSGKSLTGHQGEVYGVAFSPDSLDGKWLASGSMDGTVILWDVEKRQALGDTLTGHRNKMYGVAFSPDGKRLASGGEDNKIILWDVETRQQSGKPLTGHRGAVYDVAFSPDGKRLASASVDSTVILWDMEKRPPLGEPLTGHRHIVTSVAFSPDGKLLASGSEDNTVILWDVEKRRPLGDPLTGHRNYVWGVAFSPDGKRLASGSWDKTVILWDVETRQQLGQPLTGHRDGVNSVAFSPDGKRLASASVDSTVILWDVSLESWQARACRMANRNLTRAEWKQYLGDEPYRKTCPDLPGPEEK